jgi:signal peptidase I
MTSPNSELFLAVAGGLLNRGHRVRFRAEGGSMHPTIRSGEAIMVEPASPLDLRNGDIALYRSHRGITAHRLVGRAHGPVFVFRGDAFGDDEFVEASGVLGRVLSVERNGRSVRLSRRNAMAWRTLRRCASRIKRFVARGGRFQSAACLPTVQKEELS